MRAVELPPNRGLNAKQVIPCLLDGHAGPESGDAFIGVIAAFIRRVELQGQPEARRLRERHIVGQHADDSEWPAIDA